LVHVVDTVTYEPGRDPVSDLEAIEVELAAYGGLEDRPRMVVLNKVDIPDGAEMASLVIDEVASRGLTVFEVSAKSGQGLKEWTYAMADMVAKIREETPSAPIVPVVIKPAPTTSAPFTIEHQSDDHGGFVWRVRGEKAERWVRQTDFGNAEAAGYLADRLNKIGIEEELLALGAEPGDAVAIGARNPVVFDFAPHVDIGAELLARRGEDNRLDELRPAAQRRRVKDAQYHAQKDAERAVSLALAGLDPEVNDGDTSDETRED
jgi:GTP-binding protein